MILVRYYDETQELIRAYKDDASADDEGVADNGHCAARNSGNYTVLPDSEGNPNIADHSEQVYGDTGYMEGEYSKNKIHIIIFFP